MRIAIVIVLILSFSLSDAAEAEAGCGEVFMLAHLATEQITPEREIRRYCSISFESCKKALILWKKDVDLAREALRMAEDDKKCKDDPEFKKAFLVYGELLSAKEKLIASYESLLEEAENGTASLPLYEE